MKRPNPAVRRNVTLDRTIAGHLESAMSFTGRTQSMILETALSQPIMRRLFAFACRDGENSLVKLLDVYQAYEQHMDPRIGERILKAVKGWTARDAQMKDLSAQERLVPDLNSYICGHMTEGSMEADPFFRSAYEQAKEGKLIRTDIRSEELARLATEWIDIMLGRPNDRNLMGEPYLYRCLSAILETCFRLPSEDDIRALYRQLSDGCVLPAF